MPLPKPNEGETEKEFISRCMTFMSGEGKYDLNDEKQKKQALAICYDRWRSRNESTRIKTFGEIIQERI
jgi:hypothetical protein